MGRIKGGPSGAYWDPNDDGPDQVQVSPEERARLSGQSGGSGGSGAVPATNTMTMPGGIAPDGSHQPSGGGSAPAPAAANTGNWNREQFRDQWMGTGTDVNAQNALLAQHGIQIDGAGRARLPSGEVLDLREGARAGLNRASWGGGIQDSKTGQGPSAPSASTVGGGYSGGMGAGTAVGGGAGSGPAGPDLRSELVNMLLARSKQGLAIDKNDPNIRAQADPLAAAMERQQREYMADVAERSGPTANLRGEARMAADRTGQQVGQLEAGLIGREITARRQEIQNALSQMGAMLSDEQRLALQKELGYLDDATRRLGIESGERVGMAGVGVQSMAAQLANALGERRLDFDITDRDNYWDASNPLNAGRLGE